MQITICFKEVFSLAEKAAKQKDVAKSKTEGKVDVFGVFRLFLLVYQTL